MDIIWTILESINSTSGKITVRDITDNRSLSIIRSNKKTAIINRDDITEKEEAIWVSHREYAIDAMYDFLVNEGHTYAIS